MHEILITNDDGIEAPGLEALANALTGVGRLTVVAPDRERSAASHGITVFEPVVYHQIGDRRFAVQGTPADCVITAVMQIMTERPSLVVSGINCGLNVGHDIFYSGTVAAATEAVLHGIPAIAVSAHSDFKAAADLAAQLAHRVLKDGLPRDVLLNVNYPRHWNGQCRVTRQGRRSPEPLTDHEALAAGYVSICPLHINRSFLVEDSSWLYGFGANL